MPQADEQLLEYKIFGFDANMTIFAARPEKYANLFRTAFETLI